MRQSRAPWPGLWWLLQGLVATVVAAAANPQSPYRLPRLSASGSPTLSHDMWELVTPVATSSSSRSRRHAFWGDAEDDITPTCGRGTSGEQTRSYSFSAFGQQFHLQLRCHDNFVVPGLKVQERTANTSRWVAPEMPKRHLNCFYRGEVKGDPSSAVALSLCQGLMGHIRTSRGRFFIEPTTATLNTSGEHVIYRHQNEINHCDVEDSAGENFTATTPVQATTFSGHHQRDHLNHTRRKRSESMDLHMEVMVVVDSKMSQYHGHNLHHYVLTLMSIVASIYKDYSIGNSLSISVVKLVVIKEDEDKDIISASAARTLKSFCKWQALNNDPDDDSRNHHDTAILLTREDICRSPKKCDTLGLAELGTMCDPYRSCSIVEDNGLSAAFTIAHELGHVLSMPHDDDTLKCRKFNHGKAYHVMARMLDYNTYPWSWSACSLHYLTEFLDAGSAYCLLDQPFKNELEGRYGENSLAGEIFGDNKQCELVYGYGSIICSYMPVCKLLWCMNSEQVGCRTHHMPWADGTACGHGKWCQRGACKRIDRDALRPVNGRWSRWGKFGACSRTCGGGIQKQIRECRNPPPSNGGKFCTGKRSRFRSCGTTPCPPGSKDFRELQCSNQNGKAYSIYELSPNVTWVPVVLGVNPKDRCKLFCRVSNGNAYYALSEKVIDGTPCSPDSYDICVNGLCKSAGCDHVLNSNKKLDMCGVCGGNNSTCKTVTGYLNRRLSYGYTDIVKIPQGSTNVDIRQKGFNNSEKDDNYIALKSPDEKYILNGNFSVELFKKLIPYGGSILEYTGAGSREERINSTKPLQKDLIVQILSVKDLLPPDISFEYAISIPLYKWNIPEEWSKCSSLCQGVRHREQECTRTSDNERVEDQYCASLGRKSPRQEEACNHHCKLGWEVTHKSECSAHCGIGTRVLTIHCIQSFNGKNDRIVEDINCLHMEKPPRKEACQEPCTRARWEYGSWSKCSQSCGGGKQIRLATCVKERVVVNDVECSHHNKITEKICGDSECPKWHAGEWVYCSVTCGAGEQHRPYWCEVAGIKVSGIMCDPESIPEHKRICTMAECPTWEYDEWGQCSSSCGKGISIRAVWCRYRSGKIVDDTQCNSRDKPDEVVECPLPSCDESNHTAKYINGEMVPTPVPIQHFPPNTKKIWRTGSWGECSSTCGDGIRKRIVACYDEESQTDLDEKQCNHQPRPAAIDVCKLKRCGRWRIGEWSRCSRSCGGGFQRRQVVCQDENGSNAERCDIRKKPSEVTDCNKHVCPSWITGPWGDCTRTCNTGLQRRRVVCQSHEGKEMADSECSNDLRPDDEQACNRYDCGGIGRSHGYHWQPTSWSPCSTSCGGGFQERRVECVDENGHIVSPAYCQDTPLPTLQNCSQTDCPRWELSAAWSKCSVSCGTGIQVKRAVCVHGNLTAVAAALCSGIPPPVETRICTFPICPVHWYKSEWNQCTKSCGKGNQERLVFCVDSNHNQVDEAHCQHLDRPRTRRGCNKHACPFTWTTGEWAECSKSCGTGLQTRSVSCHQVNVYGWVNPEQVVAGCNETERPAVIQACNYGECADNAQWRPGVWTECSTLCGTGYQKRRIYCTATSGNIVSRQNCKRENRPPRKQHCWKQSCGNSSCVEIQRKHDIRADGEYMLNVRGKIIQMYCADMNTPYPQEYLTLFADPIENYSEMYSKRLINPDNCPYNGERRESCECVDDAKDRAGLTVFSKIRVNVTNLRVITDDFSFSEQYHGQPIPYGEASDCYSMANCPQGRFSINLVGTGLIISEFTEWVGQGTKVTTKILRNKDKMRVQGHCGGYCGKCTVDHYIGLQLDVAPP